LAEAVIFAGSRIMNVQVENLPNCITTLRVEVPSQKVTETLASIAGDFTRHARIPGYRAGKAPRAIIEKKFQKEIREELEKKLLSESCREAIAKNSLRVLSVAEVEDVELAPDNTMRFTATLVTAPAFELPDYKGIAVQLDPAEVAEPEVDESLENLRHQAADFTDVTGRDLQMEDYAVIDYTGSIEGRPVEEVAPKAARMLSGRSDFWIRMTPEAFMPGFSEQLVGAKAGEARAFELTAPADFPVKELAGQKIGYTVTVKSIKEKRLPELDDEFAAKIIPGKTLAELRELAQKELQTRKEAANERAKRDQIMTALLSKVECELPQNLVRYETKRILSEIVRDNQVRGISDETLKENEKEIMGNAAQGARDRLKGTFILLRIAEAEKITVTKEEFNRRIAEMGARYNMPPEKVLKELDKNGALDQVHEEILSGKTLDFLASNATVQTKA
jgi:trigger factor